MAPRGQALPQATTESAREARKSFFCELCQKGYARMNDFEAHEGSYDHQHRKRLKEMRHLTRDPAAIAKARAAEQNSGDLKSIDLSTMLTKSSSSSGGGVQKKKPVFKSTLQPHNAAALGAEVKSVTGGGVMKAGGGDGDADGDPSGAIRNGWFEDRYQPRFVTGCEDGGCGVCGVERIDLGEAVGVRP